MPHITDVQSTSSTHKILQDVQKGHADALDRLYRHYEKHVASVISRAARTGNPDHRQAAWLAVFEEARTVATTELGSGGFRAHVEAVVRRLISRTERRARRGPVLGPMENFSAVEADPVTAAAVTHVWAAAWTALLAERDEAGSELTILAAVGPIALFSGRCEPQRIAARTQKSPQYVSKVLSEARARARDALSASYDDDLLEDVRLRTLESLTVKKPNQRA
jgi:hypothetical protein